MNSIKEAQQDMRLAYFNGATGAVASATVWLIAGLVAGLVSPQAGIGTLVFGGMLIFPASLVLCRQLGRSGKHAKDNPLGPLAIYGTLWMLFCIPIALAVSMYRLDWFFPAMLLVIGGRYLTFETLYGMRTYLVFAGVLIAAGLMLVLVQAPAYWGAFVGSCIEYCFAIVLFAQVRKSDDGESV